jgi:hypothetical protein
MKKQTDKTNKNELSQNDLKNDMKTFETQPPMHRALETAEGKNNGAKPAAYKNQRSNRT